MSTIVEKKAAGQCTGCCANCKNKKQKTNVSLLRISEQVNNTSQGK